MNEEKWVCNWVNCIHGTELMNRGECSADPYRIFRYLSDCPEFRPIKFNEFPRPILP